MLHIKPTFILHSNLQSGQEIKQQDCSYKERGMETNSYRVLRLSTNWGQKHCGEFLELVQEYGTVQSLLPIVFWSLV